MAMTVPITRRKLLFLCQVFVVFLLVFYFSGRFQGLYWAAPPVPDAHHVGFSASDTETFKGVSPSGDGWIPPSQAGRFAKARALLPSILDPADTSFDRMSCPPLNETRYGYLRPPEDSAQHHYLFALNLREIIGLAPRLLGSLIEAIRFLGPRHCALSIVEGNSRDGTLELLRLLAEPLATLGVPYWLVTSPLDPTASDRITKLAILRALAVEPITGPLPASLRDAEVMDADGRAEPRRPNTYWSIPANNITDIRATLASDATVLFINDVSACAEDLLELAHQRLQQHADMVCGMDWAHNGETYSPTKDTVFFYDAWVARAIDGDTFFTIDPEELSWADAPNLFPTEPVARARMAAGLPFQVFSCWNGAVAFVAAPIFHGEVGFRWPHRRECYQGEVQLFCKDLWAAGHGKIAVVPSVNLHYGDARGRQTKAQKGYVSDFVSGKISNGSAAAGVDEAISWVGPPDLVKCMPDFGQQRWLPWNESLSDDDGDDWM